MWYHEGTEVIWPPEDAVGFVYLITRKRGGRKYCGQKLFYTNERPQPLKDGKKRKRVKKQSDWKSYFGSSKELKEDLAIEGPDGFTKEILFYCYSKVEMNWLEMKYQVENNVLLRDDFYNGFIGGKITRTHMASMARKSRREY